MVLGAGVPSFRLPQRLTADVSQTALGRCTVDSRRPGVPVGRTVGGVVSDGRAKSRKRRKGGTMERRSGSGGGGGSRGTRLRLQPPAEPGSPAVLVLSGEFDVANVPEIDRFLRRRLGPFYHRGDLVIDLSGTTFIDSSFVGFIVRLVKELRSAGKELLIVRPAGQVRRVFGIVGLANLVPVFESLEDALRTLRAGPLPLIPPRFELRRA